MKKGMVVGVWLCLLPAVGSAQFRCRDEVERLRQQNYALQQQVQSLQQALSQQQYRPYRPPYTPYGYGLMSHRGGHGYAGTPRWRALCRQSRMRHTALPE